MLAQPDQRGITLVELMIASVFALIALSAVLTVYSATALHGSQQLQRSHLHQQLYSVMHLITRDLTRAGYWHFDPRLQAATDNPFQSPTNQVQVASYAQQAPGSCILFAYDLDQDGLVGLGRCAQADCPSGADEDNVEQFGFRLRNAQVQARYGGSEFGCGSGNWQALTELDIEITRLEFTEHASCLNLLDQARACNSETPQLVQRTIEIRLSGQLQNQSTTNTTLTQWVRIRNDQLKEGSYPQLSRDGG